jgi:hypothetical protein
MRSITDIHDYYCARIKEVKGYAKSGDPWVFLMAASYIDYLVRMVYNVEQSTSNNYKKFIKDYLSLINPLYKDFVYQCGLEDLPEQMYHVLRCGIVHGFSLVPDKHGMKKGGRKRSILLGHKINGDIHFAKIVTTEYDSVLFTAEDFTEDLDKLLDKIFVDIAPHDSILTNNIINWVNMYPPIMSISID